MSTKAIREVLTSLRAPEGSRSENDRIEWALAEVSAIELAAQEWWDSESKRGRGMMSHDASATLERIAKEKERAS